MINLSKISWSKLVDRTFGEVTVDVLTPCHMRDKQLKKIKYKNVIIMFKTKNIYLIFNFDWRKISRQKNNVGDDSTDDDQKVGIGTVNTSCGLLGGKIPVRGLNP